jgi:hypothetical protein
MESKINRDDIRIQRRGAKVMSVWIKAGSPANAEAIFHQALIDQLNQDIELSRFKLSRGPFEPLGAGWMVSRRAG